MSQEPETWHVYRHSYSRHVLKHPETTLAITPTDVGSLASFELSGWDEPLVVEMLADARSDSWHGEVESLDLRWTCAGQGENAVLLGQAADRSRPTDCDSFIAVKTPRTIELPERGVYYFESSYITPLLRSEPLLPRTALAVEENVVRFDAVTFEIKTRTLYRNGLKVVAEHVEGGLTRLGLWILPIDGSERLLAAGYYFHQPFLLSHPSRPSMPECRLSLHSY